MPDDESPLERIIRQTRKRAEAQRDAKPATLTQWHCPSCAERRGAAARTPLHLVLIGGAVTEDGTVVGGRWVMACWHCLPHGQLTIAGNALDGATPVV